MLGLLLVCQEALHALRVFFKAKIVYLKALPMIKPTELLLLRDGWVKTRALLPPKAFGQIA